MPSFERESQRIVIAGASSLLGAELKSLLEESKFAGWDLRLVDEETAAGTLTEVGGEAAVVQPVEEGSFEKARLIFFAGSSQFTNTNVRAALEAGTVIDLSGAAVEFTGLSYWLHRNYSGSGSPGPQGNAIHPVPTAAGAAVTLLALALASVGLKRLVVTCTLPVSDAGRSGIEELEGQTSQLLSMRDVGKAIYDTQVAFNLLDRFGSGSSVSLEAIRKRIRAEVKMGVGEEVPRPVVQVVHAPVFYGTTFSAWAELDRAAESASIVETCKRAGFVMNEEGPSNISAAGENSIQLAVPEPDPAQLGSWWFWGAADNIRLPAWNAVKLAEKIL
jgi:aspartate-semialdehyde dehydrogenase